MAMRRVAARLGGLAFGVWALVAAVAGAATAQTLPQMRASVDGPATHERTIVVADYLAKLERASGGRLRTRLHHSATLSKDVSVPRALRDGSLEMAVPVGSVLNTFVPDLDIIQLPMFYGQPLDQQHRVFDGPVGDRINAQLEHRLGVKVIGPWLDLGFANYYSTKKPLTDFTDLAGLKIRTAADAGQFARARFFGAIPNMTPWSDLPVSLAHGLCDGLATTHESAAGARLWDVGIKHAFEDHQFIGYYIPMVSSRYWSRLSADLQRLMVDVWAENLSQYRQRMASAQDEAHIILAGHGVTFVTPTPEQLASIRARMMPHQEQIARELKLTPELVKLATETMTPGG